MAKIEILTTQEEQDSIIEALKKLKGQTVAVSKIASLTTVNKNRIRYIITDLEDMGKIQRIPTKAFNKHYIRYKYEVKER